MTEADLKRLRSSIVSTLFFADVAVSVTDLRRELERTHGIVVTAVQVRAALIWLGQMNLVRHREDRATLTEAGQDVGALRTPFPD